MSKQKTFYNVAYNSKLFIKKNQYPLVIRRIHWIVGFFVFCLLILGVYSTNNTHLSNTIWLEHLGRHAITGITVFILMLYRFYTRIKYKEYLPKLPTTFGELEKKIAIIAHKIIYFLLFTIPISGYFMACFYGFKLTFFKIPLPLFFEQNNILGNIFFVYHVLANIVLLLIIFAHIVGTIYHIIKDKTNLLKRLSIFIK